MSEVASSELPSDGFGLRTARGLVFAAAVIISLLYAVLTLYGSWDFLLNRDGVVRLLTATKAPLTDGRVGQYGGQISLPDDWKNHPGSNAWRYKFVFDLPLRPQGAQQVYLAQVADNAAITINGTRLPHYGKLGSRPDLRWSVPLLFSVDAELLRGGANELWVDVYANEPDLGALASVAIGPMRSFEDHRAAVYATKRGLAYVLLCFDLFAIFAFSLYAAAIPNRFFIVSLGLCLSLIGCLLPHILDIPLYSVRMLLSITLGSFLLMMSCVMYLISLLFPVDKRLIQLSFGVNSILFLVHLLIPIYIESHAQSVVPLVLADIGVMLSASAGITLLIREFFRSGDASVGLLLAFGAFMTALGFRDLLVFWRVLPWYQGLYSLHGVAALGLCLLGIVMLRIRAGNQEQLRYHRSMEDALVNTKKAIDQSRNTEPVVNLDALVSRIATTYSHEFRNPLAAALATTKTLQRESLGTEARNALSSIEQSIGTIGEALAKQFDFHQAMQGSPGLSDGRGLPEQLGFLTAYPSCKLVWLSDPTLSARDTRGELRTWLEPLLRGFDKIPSVCLVQLREGKTELHLYLHTNASDLLLGSEQDGLLLTRLKPETVKDTVAGRYFYWHYEYSH